MRRTFAKTLLGLTLCMWAMQGCSSDFACQFEQRESGVVIYKDSLTLTVEIVDDDIVHIVKEIDGVERVVLPEYVRVLQNQDVEWRVKQSRDRLTIATDEMRVVVSSDGVVEFERASGGSLLRESSEMTYISPEREGNVVSQAFVAGDEALYG